HLRSIEAQERTNYPLSAIVLPGEQLELKLGYQEQTLEAELVSRMLDLWQQVLQALVQQPDQPLTTLPLLTEPEPALLETRNAPWRWWWACLAFSRPAAPMCRWIQPIRQPA